MYFHVEHDYLLNKPSYVSVKPVPKLKYFYCCKAKKVYEIPTINDSTFNYVLSQNAIYRNDYMYYFIDGERNLNKFINDVRNCKNNPVKFFINTCFKYSTTYRIGYVNERFFLNKLTFHHIERLFFENKLMFDLLYKTHDVKFRDREKIHSIVDKLNAYLLAETLIKKT